MWEYSVVERRQDRAGEHGRRRRELTTTREYRGRRAGEAGRRVLLCIKAQKGRARRNAERIRSLHHTVSWRWGGVSDFNERWREAGVEARWERDLLSRGAESNGSGTNRQGRFPRARGPEVSV